MKERLQKLISGAGIASRRAAEKLILSGRVTVNGETATLGMGADLDKDIVEVDGVRIGEMSERMYIMLNKPRGYVTTLSDEKGRRTVAELVEGAGRRLYPVGRLDLNSEGLLIMTDDGEAANALMHPAHEVEKVYSVTVRGRVTQRQVAAMEALRAIDGMEIRPAKVKLLSSDDEFTRLRFTIHEGRNRQVRRMCESVNLVVTRLVRTSEGELKLGKLPSGRWRLLTGDEVGYIKSLI